ncbi:lysine ketoglutarate reductase trans-splicing protein [Zea mays]|uniref:Lysine ketoglutarate reductase trans-splicing protein n=1 Tax=Zea mays TaxID=4577 RepID=A0A1D6H4S2_MAIZE|nr:lysine ketoglutarate reductase trans-splicing protein [Zea mays]
MAKPLNGSGRSMPRSNEGMRLIFSAVVGVMLGYLFGISFPTVNITKLHFPSSIISYIEDRNSGITTQTLLNHAWASANNHKKNSSESNTDEIPEIYVPTNPKGAERLPPGIVVSETDLYPRRLWGDPSEDLTSEPRYLVTFTVGIGQKANIDAAVRKSGMNLSGLKEQSM